MNFEKNIKYLRKSKGMTQKELGEKLDCSARTVCSWEKGTNRPRFDELIKLNKLFNSNLNDLVYSDLVK